MTVARISVPQSLYEKLRLRAQVGGKQTDELARDLLAQALDIKLRPAKKGQRLDLLVNLKFHGPKDLAQNVDRYLYDKR